MRVRRLIVGLTLVGVVLGGLAPGASAAGGPTVPTPEEIQRDIASIIPAPPQIGVPDIDPQHPQIPALPYVAIPPGLQPAFGILSPLGVPLCQAGYLGPLAGVVALTAVFAALPQEPPVAPSFISPLFGPVNTLCVLGGFPKYKTCGVDTQINDALKNGPELPSVGGISVDVFSMVPAPFATVIGVIAAVEVDIQDYVLNGTPPPDLVQPLVDQIGCSTS
jgi:hypothetical protein